MNDQTQPAQMTPQQRQAIAKAKARLRLQQMGQPAGTDPNASNPIIAAQRQSQTQAMSQWAQQQEARKAAEARQAQERREAARSLGGGMDMMVGQDAAGNVRPGSVVDTDLGAGITGSPLSFGQGLAEGAANTANTVFAASTGLGNAALNVFDPNRQQSQPMRIQVPRNALLDDGGALQSMSGTVPRIAGQIAGPRVAIGKVTPGGGFGANAAKDAIAIGAGTPQDMPRLSDMFPEGTPIADMLRTREGDNAFTAFGKNAAEDLLASTVAGGILKGGGMLLDAFGRPRASVQATTATPVSRASPEVAEAPPQPAPFSAPAEPKASSFLQNNADRIVGGSVGGFLGGAGDAFAASGGDGNGGPDIINPYTGAFAGMLLPRAAARGYRAAGSAIGGAGFNEAVSVRRVRNLLDAAGRSADEIIANDTALYGGAEGGKPSVLADLTQNAQNFSVGLSRQGGDAPELASQQAADLARTRTGRLFSDVEATTNINPATVTADLDAAIKQASEEISPAYEALFGKYAGVNSERLMQLADDPVVGKYVRAAIKEAESLQTTAGQAPSNARTWDLVKRALDRPIDKAFSGGSRPSEALLRAREAVVRELDELMPEYAAVREGADAPRMKGARKEGAKIAGGGLSVEKVRAIASKLTGKPLTALQMSAVEKIVLDIEKARGIDGLASERMREVLGAVFGQDTADKLVARIRADQTILKNAQRRDPDIGAVSSQAGMADRGIGELAADAFRAVRSPVEAALAALSRSGAYTQDQRNRIAQMLYGGATPENLARIYGPRPPRNPLNVEPPPTPQGPPTNALAPRRPEQAGFGGSRDFPMDEASRMGRAREQGFDVDNRVYHGSSKSGGFDEFQTSERGRFGPGVYFSEQPGVAGKYGEAKPYVVPTNDQLFDAMPSWNSLSDDAEQRIIKQLKPNEREKLAALKNWYKREGEAFWEALRRSVDGDDKILADARASEVIQAAGFKGIRGIGDGQETVIFNPKNVRSPDAAFDPAETQSSKLLAGVSGSPEGLGAAGGAAIGMATAPDQNGDGVVDAQERMLGGAGGALTGGIAGRGVRGGMNALAPKPGATSAPARMGIGGSPPSDGPAIPRQITTSLFAKPIEGANRITRTIDNVEFGKLAQNIVNENPVSLAADLDEATFRRLYEGATEQQLKQVLKSPGGAKRFSLATTEDMRGASRERLIDMIYTRSFDAAEERGALRFSQP
jgi:hypothetical protein